MGTLRDITIPTVRAELASPIPQARSQALHTLSQIRVPEAWPWIFPHMLRDDDEVVRVAWRLAVAIVPEGSEPELADVLVSQFDRGNMEVKPAWPGPSPALPPGTPRPWTWWMRQPGPVTWGFESTPRQPGQSSMTPK